MAGDAEASHRTAEIALEALKRIGLPATPRNFELWFSHIEGKNPSLSREIQISIGSSGKLAQDVANKLYNDHIQHADLSRDVIELVTKFKAEVSDLHDIIEQTGENANGHKETLRNLTGQLKLTREEFPAVGRLLEGVISVAKDMRYENEKLEHRLAESANEIVVLQRSVENIQAEAMKDFLTGIANRSTFDKSIQTKIAEANRTGEPLALILADIDHFKQFNDKWGHQTGDQVLRLVAEVMDANVKGQDILARYGGEEFAIILPDTTLENAHMLADRIRQAVESRRLKKRRTEEDLGVITMSMGVSLLQTSDTLDSFIERADQCLYTAKANGRNCVVDEKLFDHRVLFRSTSNG